MTYPTKIGFGNDCERTLVRNTRFRSWSSIWMPEICPGPDGATWGAGKPEGPFWGVIDPLAEAVPRAAVQSFRNYRRNYGFPGGRETGGVEPQRAQRTRRKKEKKRNLTARIATGAQRNTRSTCGLRPAWLVLAQAGVHAKAGLTQRPQRSAKGAKQYAFSLRSWRLLCALCGSVLPFAVFLCGLCASLRLCVKLYNRETL
jgi:hypothetical protein